MKEWNLIIIILKRKMNKRMNKLMNEWKFVQDNFYAGKGSVASSQL